MTELYTVTPEPNSYQRLLSNLTAVLADIANGYHNTGSVRYALTQARTTVRRIMPEITQPTKLILSDTNNRSITITVDSKSRIHSFNNEPAIHNSAVSIWASAGQCHRWYEPAFITYCGTTVYAYEGLMCRTPRDYLRELSDANVPFNEDTLNFKLRTNPTEISQ